MLGMDQGAEIGGQMAQDFKGCEDLEVEENIKWLNNSMYVVYEEHIEQLEEENADLKQEVLVLRKRLQYYKFVLEDEESNK